MGKLGRGNWVRVLFGELYEWAGGTVWGLCGGAVCGDLCGELCEVSKLGGRELCGDFVGELCVEICVGSCVGDSACGRRLCGGHPVIRSSFCLLKCSLLVMTFVHCCCPTCQGSSPWRHGT